MEWQVWALILGAFIMSFPIIDHTIDELFKQKQPVQIIKTIDQNGNTVSVQYYWPNNK